MDVEFCMQDPTDPDTRYLYEAIIAAVADATTWRGMYAFATRGGVDQLIEDPIVLEFLRRGGEIDLIVGIDAVTNKQSLIRMQELEGRYRKFRPRVFWNSTRGLFHPKISYFGYANGDKTLIVGSGNFTPGGLTHNFEAYNVISSDRREKFDLSSLDQFMARHAGDIRPIDQAALDRAALNLVRPVAGVPRARLPTTSRPARPTPGTTARPAVASGERILIAQVPAAGGRWSQVHFNADIVRQYFQVSDNKIQRVYLTRIESNGVRGEEEVRPVVYSEANKNHKIEIAGAKGLEYPSSPPILVFRERQVRTFDYMLLMPGSPGYDAVRALSIALPTIGRGLRRAITNLDTLEEAWPDSPMVESNDDVPMEI
jgi:HKD family nuclease